jgi:putative NADH-flavin reductase
MHLLILGATGGTGVQLCRQALERGHAVTAFARSPEKLPVQHARLSAVRGDPTDAEQLRKALGGRDAVLSALGVTSRQDSGILASAARSTIQAMCRTSVRRLIIVSQALLYPDVGPLGPVLRYFLAHHLRDSAAMERLVEASGLDWTVVRPSRLTNGPGEGRYRLSEGAAPPGFSIARADVARAILDCCEQGTHVHRVVGLSK